MLPDLYTDFSKGRSGGLVFPSLSEFSTGYCDPHKGFGIVNKAEIDAFLELSCFFHDPTDVGHLISGSSAFCKTSLIIWNFTIHVLLKPGLENFEHYFTRVWDECNCAVLHSHEEYSLTRYNMELKAEGQKIKLSKQDLAVWLQIRPLSFKKRIKCGAGGVPLILIGLYW